MKIVFWLLLAAMLIWAWQNPEKVRDAGDNTSKWVGEKSRWIADQWDPLPPPPPPPAAAPAQPVEPPLPDLPEGVYLLRQEVQIATGKGLVKWPAGFSVRKLGEGAGKTLVSDGVNQTTVDPSLLTREEAERKVFYKMMETANARQTSAAARELEMELAELEAKISKLQQEKRNVSAARAVNGGVLPFGTSEEFLENSIKRAEERRGEIYKILGRSPRTVTVK